MDFVPAGTASALQRRTGKVKFNVNGIFGMAGKKWAYEDLVEGRTVALGSKTVTAGEIVEFASEFDAQPMHLDEEAGKASILGGLSASGWHTCAMFMRLLCDGFLLDFDIARFAGAGLCTLEKARARR